MKHLSEVSADTRFLKMLAAEMCDGEQALLYVTESGMPERKIKIPAQDLAMGVSTMALDTEKGYSIAPNTIADGAFGNIAAFHSIVLDISGNNVEAAKKLLTDSNGHPPNVAVMSGKKRLQLWWLLHRLGGGKESICPWQKAANTLAMRVRQLLAGISGITVRAGTNPTEGFSLPGSIDLGSGSRAEAQFFREDRYSLDDLLLLALPQGKDWLCSTGKGSAIPADRIADWSEEMLGKIEALRKQRKALIGKEFRNNYCFVYFCLLLNLPIAAAEIERRITEFNQGFLKPLSEYELRRTLATAWEKKYRLSTARIVDFLGITKEEAEKLSIQFPNQVSAAEKRRLRNEEIVKLRNMGYTHSEIAKIVRASVKTVQTVAKEKGASTLAERILTLHESGLSRSEIAKAANCTERYVRAVIKSGGCSAQPEQTGNFSYNGLPQAEGPQGVPCPQGASQIMQTLSPALAALRNELKKRYGIGMSDSDFDQHFALILERIIPCGEPTIADVEADFSGQLSPSQDEMYRYFLNLT